MAAIELKKRPADRCCALKTNAFTSTCAIIRIIIMLLLIALNYVNLVLCSNGIFLRLFNSFSLFDIILYSLESYLIEGLFLRNIMIYILPTYDAPPPDRFPFSTRVIVCRAHVRFVNNHSR